MSGVDLLNEALAVECIHGLTKRTCSICLERAGWGKLGQKTYNTHLVDAFPERFKERPETTPYCEECKQRGACKGNRVNVRIPRGRLSFGVGAPIHPPSWQGELMERPVVHKATHRFRGRWLCDRCHDRGRPATAHVVGKKPEKVQVLTHDDIF